MLTLQTLAEMRELSHELRPTMLDDLGLVPTLRWYVRQFGRRLDIAVTFEPVDIQERLSSDVETVLYRVVQEALTNVVRHAKAQAIDVNLRRDRSTLVLIVADDGIGFDAPAGIMEAHAGQGMGLLGMRERVAAIGGCLQVESTPGRGTRLTVTLPCPLP
jgi:signal transduction histidine kinase